MKYFMKCCEHAARIAARILQETGRCKKMGGATYLSINFPAFLHGAANFHLFYVSQKKLNMEDDVLMLIGVTLCVVIGCAIRMSRVNNCSRTRRVWVRNLFRKRSDAGAHVSLVPHLIDESEGYNFRNYLRMDETTFNLLLSTIKDSITGSSQFRKPISPEEKLMVTLRYLATGMLKTSVHNNSIYLFWITD